MHRFILGLLFSCSISLGYGVAEVERLEWLLDACEPHEVINRVGNHLLIEFNGCVQSDPAP